MDWSYNLLTAQERRLFNRLTVFMGGWSLEAAEAICTGDEIAQDDVLDLVTHLVDKSMVQAEEQGGAARYRLLETMRAYASAKLVVSGEAPRVRTRHRDWYLALTESAPHSSEVWSPERLAWAARLRIEHDNLRAALQWTLQNSEVQLGLRLVCAASGYWRLRGYFSEARDWFARVLALPATTNAALRASALYQAGGLAFAQGEYTAARALRAEGLTLYRQVGSTRELTQALRGLGIICQADGDYLASHALLQECLVLVEALGDKREIGHTFTILGHVAYHCGDRTAAERLSTRALAMWQEVGSAPDQEWPLHTLGQLAQDRGEYPQAGTYFRRALALNRQANSLEGLGMSLFHLGTLALDRGDYGHAHAWLSESLTLQAQRRAKGRVVTTLDAFASLAVAEGQPTRALRVAGAAATVREAIGARQEPVWQDRMMRVLARARQALSVGADEASWAEGQAMSLEQAIAYALEDIPEATEQTATSVTPT